MDREQILQKFETLRQWGSRGERAPHKPLLVLYAIGKLLRGEDRLLSYKDDIEENLKSLLSEFGPKRDSYYSHFPFWRLQNDGVWEVTDADSIRLTDSGDAYVTDLRESNVSGGFHETISEQLQQDSELTSEIIHSLLNAHFDQVLHSDILQAVGIEYPLPAYELIIHPSTFRNNVLSAYNYKCSVCGFDVRLRSSPVALNACHIKWKSAGGPDETGNGLALCALHHKLLHRGTFTLSEQHEVLVSTDVDGSTGFQEWLMNFHGQSISLPQRRSYYPEEEFIGWHVREVFKGDYREL